MDAILSIPVHIYLATSQHNNVAGPIINDIREPVEVDDNGDGSVKRLVIKRFL